VSALHERYDRNIRLFGEEGQRKLRQTTVTFVGVGGVGSPFGQHVALLGIGHANLVEPQELDNTNRNRFIGARHDDPVPGSPKVSLAARMIREINPDVGVTEIQAGLVSEEAFAAVKSADWVVGGLDQDGPRHILNELCAAYGKPYIDLAADIPEPGIYGGRICVSWDGNGCLHCLGQLDPRDVRAYLSSEAERAEIARIYGVPVEALGRTGPSVSPVNGVVASLAAVEFMAAVTGMRAPRRLVNYRGDLSIVTVSRDPPAADCEYCKSIRGLGARADVERYLRMPHLRTLDAAVHAPARAVLAAGAGIAR
jgi:molybdopterin/thiamine biosynthesis adenylyltransferase